MIVEIKHGTKVMDVQRKFKCAYPYLKLDFFDRPHGWQESVGQAHRYDPGFTLLRLEKKSPAAASITINRWDKTGSLEVKFRELFGLYVQVYRRSGYNWIQTAGTDELTLDEQNEIGRRSIAEYKDNLWIEREALL